MARSPSSQVRLPAVAGSFYPSHPEKLAHMVDTFLADGRTRLSATDSPRILIVPHAGYVYSGCVAGAGFALLGDVHRVILLGISHHHLFAGAALYGGDFWQTPLGNVEVDRETLTALLRESPTFYVDNDVHEPEHGLEVEVPFLQRALGAFKIAPVLLSEHSASALDRVAAELAGLMDERTLLVVSSDLSHYPRQADAERVDSNTINAILSGDTDRFQAAVRSHLTGRVPALYTCACGAEAIKVGMKVARLINVDVIRLLEYANSGQVGGDSSRVVGYAAVGFHGASSSRPA